MHSSAKAKGSSTGVVVEPFFAADRRAEVVRTTLLLSPDDFARPGASKVVAEA